MRVTARPGEVVIIGVATLFGAVYVGIVTVGSVDVDDRFVSVNVAGTRIAIAQTAAAHRYALLKLGFDFDRNDG